MSRTPAATTTEFLPFARPSITALEREAILDVLDSGWLTTGPRTKEFEARFAETVGSRHAVALNSATAALHLALEGLGVGPGDEVIVPTWTFAASAEVIVYRGAVPIMVDVDESTLNATLATIEEAITPRTKALMAVHFGGQPMAIGEIVGQLDRRGIPVIEDSAHAFPSRIASLGGRFAGTIGRVGSYSFYATKTITTGEGGMLVTDDDSLADRARLMSLHGISRAAWNRYAAGGSWSYEIEDAGYKYNMTDLAAALGLAQLSRAEELLTARRDLAAGYRERFLRSEIDDLIELPEDASDGSHAWHLYVVRLRLERLSIDRAAVMDQLQERGIGASVHFIPLHLHPYYRARPETTPRPLPVATREFQRVVSLPIWPGMTDANLDRVVAAVGAILGPCRR
jgi:dTDP-4-amino-4,6-dideoxygalactose transaminase